MIKIWEMSGQVRKTQCLMAISEYDDDGDVAGRVAAALTETMLRP